MSAKKKKSAKTGTRSRKLALAGLAVLAALALSVAAHQLLKPKTKYVVGDCFCVPPILCGKITKVEKDAYIAELYTPVGILKDVRAPMKEVDADQSMVRVNCETGEPLDASAK